MQEFLSQDKAKQWIKFIASFCKDPVGFSYEDWKDWRPRIERARGVVRDEDLKYIATNTIIFFDEYYSLTKKFKPNFVLWS
jgi:hypothetical protein